MNTAGQNPSGQPPPAATEDLLLAEAMALTLHDYRDAFDEIEGGPRADEVRASAGLTPMIQGAGEAGY